MSGYQTVVVGTDGSQTSLHAVDRAAEIAAESNAKLIIATGYSTQRDDLRAADVLRGEAYMVQGNAPIYAILRDARNRAKASGVKSIEERPIKGAPVAALVDVAVKAKADLLVVGNVGLNARYAILGRLFSIPGKVSRRAKTDVLIVNTTGRPV
ncbi:MAG: universal stress protein [Mycobacterium sp.]|nr:universal stress protein [Mycobacterium sp.]MBV9353141.1 universal stress protein [Mycobacterium sp.]